MPDFPSPGAAARPPCHPGFLGRLDRPSSGGLAARATPHIAHRAGSWRSPRHHPLPATRPRHSHSLPLSASLASSSKHSCRGPVALKNRRNPRGQANRDRAPVQGVWRRTRTRAGPGTPGRRQAGHRGPDRAVDRRVRRQFHHRAGRNLRRHGPVGLGQIDPGAHVQPPDRADGRPHRGRRRGHRAIQRQATARLPPQAHQHGVPVVRAAAAFDGAAEHRLRAGAGRRAAGRTRGRRPCRAGAGGPGRVGRQLPRRTVGRHAATRGPGARAGGRPVDPADGRGLLGPRPHHPHRDAGRAAAPAAGQAPHHRLHLARPGRGHAHRRPRGHHEGRPGGAGGHAGGNPAPAGRRLRAPVRARRGPGGRVQGR